MAIIVNSTATWSPSQFQKGIALDSNDPGNSALQAVVNAEAALLKARAQLGLDPLFTKTQTAKPTRRPGTH